MWFGRVSDVVQMWVGGGSDVFSDLVQPIWQKLRESGFQRRRGPELLRELRDKYSG